MNENLSTEMKLELLQKQIDILQNQIDLIMKFINKQEID